MIPRSYLQRVFHPKRIATLCPIPSKLLTMCHHTSPNASMHISMLKRRLAAFSTLIAMCSWTIPSHGASISHRQAPSGQMVILVTGEIVQGDIQRMRQALLAGIDQSLNTNFGQCSPHITVLLNSPGGVLYPSLEIGRMIRSAGASTVAVTQCASACHAIWSAGVSRYVVAGSQLAIHYPYREGNTKEPAFDAFSDLVNYYRHMGATAELALDIAASAPNRLKFLSLNDAKRHGLAFATIDQ